MPEASKENARRGAGLYYGLALLAVSAAAGAWLLSARGAQVRAAARLVLHGISPCSGTVTYSIGAVDPRYGISDGELSADVNEANSVWEAALKRRAFVYVPSGGDITINMIYDQRQASLDKLRRLGYLADRGLDGYKSLKARYDALAARVDPRQAELNSRLAAYRAHADDYNAAVADLNSVGRANPRQRQLLAEFSGSLDREFAGIKSYERALNSDIDTLNAMATELNQLIVELRLDAAQYRREGSALGLFEEGDYQVQGGLRSIDLYKYTGRQQLTRLLAHELGHALGLDHVRDPAALMAPVNRGDDIELAPDDLAELRRVCRPAVRRLFSGKGRARNI